MSQILRFNLNIPEQIALRDEEGRRVQGRYGEQTMYSLADGRVMYVPLYVEQRIVDLALAAGEPFEICKGEVHSGNQRWIEWQVRRVEPQQPAQSRNFPAAAASGAGYRQNQPHPITAQPYVNGATLRVPQLPAPIQGKRDLMEAALSEAVAIARRVENEAASQHYFVRFSNEDIRAIGVTIFIQRSREEGSRWPQ
ncbi:MAG: hypothetical protein KIT09_10290 [Bryobacteraceae bacterium]|nr:hypothetical protein [Bryobacteraceae bacterium]